jgi:hypothetical protein
VDRATERTREIEAAIVDIREIETRGVTRENLRAIRTRPARLAARTGLFTAADFTPASAAAAQVFATWMSSAASTAWPAPTT